MRKLTPRQAVFVDEYLVCLSATKAAIKAGYSFHSARDIGQQLLAKPHISRLISERKQGRAERTGITSERVVDELSVIGFSDIRHYALTKNTTTDLYEITLADGAPDYAMRAIAGVKHKVREFYGIDGEVARKEHDVEFRLWDKNTALTNLAKHTGTLVEPDKAGDTIINIQVVRYGDTIIEAQGRDAQSHDSSRLQAPQLPTGLPTIDAERY